MLLHGHKRSALSNMDVSYFRSSRSTCNFTSSSHLHPFSTASTSNNALSLSDLLHSASTLPAVTLSALTLPAVCHTSIASSPSTSIHASAVSNFINCGPTSHNTITSHHYSTKPESASLNSAYPSTSGAELLEAGIQYFRFREVIDGSRRIDKISLVSISISVALIG